MCFVSYKTIKILFIQGNKSILDTSCVPGVVLGKVAQYSLALNKYSNRGHQCANIQDLSSKGYGIDMNEGAINLVQGMEVRVSGT